MLSPPKKKMKLSVFPYNSIHRNHIECLNSHNNFNGYIMFTSVSSLVEILAGLDLFHHFLTILCQGQACYHLHIKAIGKRMFDDSEVVCIHMRACKIRQPHVDAQDMMLTEYENIMGKEMVCFPMLGTPKGTLLGKLINVTNIYELYRASEKLCGVDTHKIEIPIVNHFQNTSLHSE